jgi:hypothetical protein
VPLFRDPPDTLLAVAAALLDRDST